MILSNLSGYPTVATTRRGRASKFGLVQTLLGVKFILQKSLGQFFAVIHFDLFGDFYAFLLQDLNHGVFATRVKHSFFDGAVVARHGIDES